MFLNFVGLQDMFCSFFSIIGYVFAVSAVIHNQLLMPFSVLVFIVVRIISNYAGIRLKGFSVMLKATRHISSVWPHFYGLQQLLLLFTGLLSDIKQMWRI